MLLGVTRFEVFRVVARCSVVVGYQCFGRSCCLHYFRGIRMMEAARCSERFISSHHTTWLSKPQNCELCF